MTARGAGRTAGAIALAAVVSLSSCASPAYETETAALLQGDVHAIAAASADGDWAAAVARLDAMADRLDRAHSDGRMGDDRYESIAAAMRVVRKDLETAILNAESEAERRRLLEAQATLEERLRELAEQQSSGEDGGGGSDRGDHEPGHGKGKDTGLDKGKGNGKDRGKSGGKGRKRGQDRRRPAAGRTTREGPAAAAPWHPVQPFDRCRAQAALAG